MAPAIVQQINRQPFVSLFLYKLISLPKCRLNCISRGTRSHEFPPVATVIAKNNDEMFIRIEPFALFAHTFVFLITVFGGEFSCVMICIHGGR